MKWIELNKKNYKWIATFPCDTPFFDIKVIEYLKKKSFETKKKLGEEQVKKYRRSWDIPPPSLDKDS